MAWQPQAEPLRQLAGYLKDSLSGYDPDAQKHATLMLSQAKSSPDINNYLTYLFASRQPPSSLAFSTEDFHSARCAAAIMLKNNISSGYKAITDEHLSYIRSSIIGGLQDPNSQIRNYAGNVIAEIVRQGGILGWQQLLPELISLASNESGSTSSETQEGAMSALSKVCEDNKRVLDKDYQGQRPLNFIVPKLLELTTSQLPKVRADALISINVFIPQKPQALLVGLDALLNNLFALASDPNATVRRNVCRAFVLIIDIRPDKIAPHMAGLVDYMITQQRNTDDPDLALDAAEFWLCVGEHDRLRTALGPYLEKIVPVLLVSMIYSEDEILMLEGGEDDAEAEDKAEDIKPQFAKVKATRAGVSSNGLGDSSAAGLEPGKNDLPSHRLSLIRVLEDDDELSEGEIEEDYGEGREQDPEERWNLRKCSAAALDVLASVFHGPVFAITLPYLMDNLRHSEWPHREAAVLALGAVADGCMEMVTPHLPELVPYLISLLDDPEPVVRQITCWTLGRYSGWASQLKDSADKARYFEPMMEGILTKMLDNNKRVQEAGASAFAHLEEKATQELMPYCEPIVRQFVQCFEKYKDRNMFILYDCVQTLAEHVGPKLAREDLVNLLMPALIERWNKISDQSREIFPLLECLSYVATALGNAFAPFAGPLFARCIRIIHQNLEEYLAAVNNEVLDKPDKDFLVTSLDLLSAIIQALDENKSAELVASTQPRFFDLLAFCMEDPSNDVRQSSYALLGDCAIFISPQLQAYLPTLMPILIKQLDLDQTLDEQILTGFSVVNNACWSCGEICYKQRERMIPYCDGLYPKLRAIILNPEIPESVNENGAIALGRLAVGAYEQLTPLLGEFAEPFLDSMEKVSWTEEKDSAFEGFTEVVLRNPEAMEVCLPKFFEAIARYTAALHPDTGTTRVLKPLFSRAVNGYRSIIPDFKSFLSQLSPENGQLLQREYQL
ncbi:MAG: hypothetical protein M1837_005383 [Sclerophora amabilis]|nr:MAG: hypothetical protein M1837_005383 [Sclerophora amabilis]